MRRGCGGGCYQPHASVKAHASAPKRVHSVVCKYFKVSKSKSHRRISRREMAWSDVHLRKITPVALWGGKDAKARKLVRRLLASSRLKTSRVCSRTEAAKEAGRRKWCQ